MLSMKSSIVSMQVRQLSDRSVTFTKQIEPTIQRNSEETLNQTFKAENIYNLIVQFQNWADNIDVHCNNPGKDEEIALYFIAPCNKCNEMHHKLKT